MPADLELALRVRADMREALQGIGMLNRTLGDTARRGGEAGVALEGAAGAAQALTAAVERAPRAPAGGTWIEAMQASLGTLARESESTLDHARNAAESAFGAMESALTHFVTTGKLSFSDFANSVLSDLARIAIQQAITIPLAGALFGFFAPSPAVNPAQLGGIGIGVRHAGGTAGALGGVRRAVPPTLFAGAERYHGGGIAGLRADEVPIIAERGETILPRGAAIAPPAVEINFHNEGTPQREVRRAVQLDPRGLVVTIFTDDIQRGGPIRQTMERELLGGGTT